MQKIRYIRPDALPKELNEEDRQLVTQLFRHAPKPIWLYMVHPFQWTITETTLTAWKEILPQEVLQELRLLKGKVFDTQEAFLLACESRIGQKTRATYEETLLTYGLDPISGDIVPAQIPPLSTATLETIIASIHHVLAQVVSQNSNACQCWREYGLLEEQKMDLIEIFGTGGTSYRAGRIMIDQGRALLSTANKLSEQDMDAATRLIENAQTLIERGTGLLQQAQQEIAQPGNLSKTAFEKKITDLDRFIQQRWKKDTPARFAKHLDEGVCPYCGKPRQLDETLSLGTPEFLHNLLNVAIGGELPLVSVLPFVQEIFAQIYNPEMIPESKKKAMEAFTKRLQLQKLLDLLMTKVLSVFGMTPASFGASVPNMNTDSTPTTPPTGNSPRMMLTPDFRPDSETGSMMNGANNSDNNEMNLP